MRCRFCKGSCHMSEAVSDFCSNRCRMRYRRAQARVGHEAKAQTWVDSSAERGLQFVLERQACGKKWFRGRYADELEAHGLPGNVVVAAAVLGLDAITLRKRLVNGTDLLAPLKPDSRHGRRAYVPLVIPPARVLAKVRIHSTGKEIELRKIKARVKREAVPEI